MKKIDQEEINQILADHRLWLDSDGEQGRRASFFRKDLSGSDLTGADLTEADSSVANFRGVDLTGAKLFRADLTRSDLTGADLTGADLTDAHLSGANLSFSNLSGADLTGANLWGVNLIQATLPLSIRDCLQFDKALFSSDALPWLILHPWWSKWKDSVQIAQDQATMSS